MGSISAAMEAVDEYVELKVPLRYTPTRQDLVAWQKVCEIAGCVAIANTTTLSIVANKKYTRKITVEEFRD